MNKQKIKELLDKYLSDKEDKAHELCWWLSKGWSVQAVGKVSDADEPNLIIAQVKIYNEMCKPDFEFGLVKIDTLNNLVCDFKNLEDDDTDYDDFEMM